MNVIGGFTRNHLNGRGSPPAAVDMKSGYKSDGLRAALLFKVPSFEVACVVYRCRKKLRIVSPFQIVLSRIVDETALIIKARAMAGALPAFFRRDSIQAGTPDEGSALKP